MAISSVVKEGVDSESLGSSISRGTSYEALNDEERTGKHEIVVTGESTVYTCVGTTPRVFDHPMARRSKLGLRWLPERLASGQLSQTRLSSSGSSLHPISGRASVGTTVVYAGAGISANQAEGGNVLTYPNWNFYRTQPPHPTHVLRWRR